MNRLLVGNRNDGKQECNNQGDGKGIVQCRGACSCQDDKCFLRSVGDGGKSIRTKNGKANCLADSLVRCVSGGKRTANQPGSPGSGLIGSGDTIYLEIPPMIGFTSFPWSFHLQYCNPSQAFQDFIAPVSF